MTEQRFYDLISGFDIETQNEIDAEIARIQVYDYDLENIDWQIFFDQIVAAIFRSCENNRIEIQEEETTKWVDLVCSAIELILDIFSEE